MLQCYTVFYLIQIRKSISYYQYNKQCFFLITTKQKKINHYSTKSPKHHSLTVSVQSHTFLEVDHQRVHWQRIRLVWVRVRMCVRVRVCVGVRVCVSDHAARQEFVGGQHAKDRRVKDYLLPLLLPQQRYRCRSRCRHRRHRH